MSLGNKRLLIETKTESGSGPGETTEGEKRLAGLFERMGGKGKVKIYRTVGGSRVFCGSFPCDDNLCTNFEEIVSNTFGGGKYQATFMDGTKFQGSLTFDLDEKIKPQATAEEREAEERKRHAPQGPSPSELAHLIQQAVKAAVAELAPKNDGMGDILKMYLASQERNADRMLAMVQAQSAAQLSHAQMANPLALAPVDPMQALRNAAEMARTIDDLRGGSQGPPNTKAEFAMRILEKPLTHGLERIADRVVDGFQKEQGGATQALAAASPKPEVKVEPHKPGEPVFIPGGAKPLTKEELAKLRQRSQERSGASAIPNAPRVDEALPAAVGGGKK